MILWHRLRNEGEGWFNDTEIKLHQGAEKDEHDSVVIGLSRMAYYKMVADLKD